MEFKIGDKVMMVKVFHPYTDHENVRRNKIIGEICDIDESSSWNNDNGCIEVKWDNCEIRSSSDISPDQLIPYRTTINPNFKNYTKQEQRI